MKSALEPRVTRAVDPLQSLTRVGIGLLLLLAVLNGGFLYFFPAQAEPDYAWAIKPTVSAAFMGAGYLAGALGAALSLFVARHWRSVRGLVPGFCLLGLALLTATLIHSDKFRWDYAPTWGWTVVYAGLPPVAIYLWLRQDRTARDEPPAKRSWELGLFPTLSLGVGLVLLVVAVILFIAPLGLLADWPWPLTPLIARVLAGWYLLSAATLLFMGSSVRRAHELPLPYATVACWSLLVLVLPLLYSEIIDTGAPLFIPFLSVHALTLALCAVIVVSGLALSRRDGHRL